MTPSHRRALLTHAPSSRPRNTILPRRRNRLDRRPRGGVHPAVRLALPAHDLTPPAINLAAAAPGSAPRSRHPVSRGSSGARPHEVVGLLRSLLAATSAGGHGDPKPGDLGARGQRSQLDLARCRGSGMTRSGTGTAPDRPVRAAAQNPCSRALLAPPSRRPCGVYAQSPPDREALSLTKNPAFAGFFESGRPDLNRDSEVISGRISCPFGL